MQFKIFYTESCFDSENDEVFEFICLADNIDDAIEQLPVSDPDIVSWEEFDD